MRGSPTAQAAFAILCAFVARWYAYILQLYMHFQVELDHGRGGARSGAGCPPSESPGAKVHVQPTVTALFTVLHVELRVIARHVFAVIVPFIIGN